MEIFAVKNLTFSYPENERDVLKDLSFTVSKGEFITLCGKSGCGKSTLLKHFKTALTPHGNRSGKILFLGKSLDDADFRTQTAKIGFVGQSPDNQIVTDKVWHELSFGLESLGLDNTVIRRRVAEIASFFGIGEWFEADVATLSGGQKQLLNLASVMVLQPDIIILDEPTSQLDPIAAGEFLSALSKINREFGTTVFLSEHRLEEVFPISSRVIVMDDGKIIADDTPDNIGTALKSLNSTMLASMPSAMRIWDALEQDNSKRCPITVSDAKSWLSEYASHHTAVPLTDQKVTEHYDEPVIALSNAWFRYQKNSPDVLKGISLKVYKGELLAVVGGNGTGKTSMLSLVSGINKPYRGSVKPAKSRLGVLPQNPQSVFIKNSVIENLYDVSGDASDKEKLAKIAGLCDIEHLLKRHVYDLSGGEQQRVALAKVLLTEPEVLLLDEPTKGMDADFKNKFAAVLKRLLAKGITVLMVSHDIEFCAAYADRCALFFNGTVIAEGSPREFFSDNSFYTTAASRIAKNIVPGAVTAEDIISAFGGQVAQKPDVTQDDIGRLPEIPPATNKPKTPIAKKATLALGLLTSAIAVLGATEIIRLPALTSCSWLNPYLWFILPFILLTIAFWKRSKPKPQDELNTVKAGRRLPKRTIAASVMVLLAIPITILIGVFLLNDEKYLFISLLVLMECMLPFFLVFEGRKPKPRELVIIAVLCALGVAGRMGFYMLPQFKPVTALTIIAGVAFGGETGFLVGAVTMLLSNIMFQQGPWTPWQMFAMGIIGFLAGILFKKSRISHSRSGLCIFGFIAPIVIYSGIMNPAALLMTQMPITKASLVSYFIAGLPMDTVHAVATAFFLFWAAEPMLEKLERIKIKYGLLE